jgi:hypothetical protein
MNFDEQRLAAIWRIFHQSWRWLCP